MKKIEGFNRNLMGGKRPHKGITKLGHLTLAQRVLAEGKALTAYQKRVGQYKGLTAFQTTVIQMLGKPARGRSFAVPQSHGFKFRDLIDNPIPAYRTSHSTKMSAQGITGITFDDNGLFTKFVEGKIV